MTRPAPKTTHKKTVAVPARIESRMEAYLVTAHGGKELTVIVTTDMPEALRQAREEEVVREAIERDGGIWIMPLRD